MTTKPQDLNAPITEEERDEMKTRLTLLEQQAHFRGDIDEVERLAQIDLDRAILQDRRNVGN